MSYAVRLLVSVVFLLFSSASCLSQASVGFGSQGVSEDVLALPPLPAGRYGTEAIAGDAKPSHAGDASDDANSASISARSLSAAQRQNISQLCRDREVDSAQCKVHWTPVLTQSLQWLAIQHEGNWGMEYWMRYETFHEPYWRGYKKALAGWRWTRWNDDDPFLDDYVGHPIMGAITSAIYIQNDPKSSTLEFGDRHYWKSRLGAAFWYSAAYSAQWKIGPASEASLEKVGSFYYYDAQFNKTTNGSGIVDFVVTPVGGTAWLVAEDIVDKYAMRRLENVSRNPVWLTALAFMEPCRSAANVLRFKAPWYRDNRRVKAFEKRGKMVAASTQEPDSAKAGLK